MEILVKKKWYKEYGRNLVHEISRTDIHMQEFLNNTYRHQL